MRTTDDYPLRPRRCDSADNTYRLTIDDTNEAGTVQHFLVRGGRARTSTGGFSELCFELAERTFAQRTRRDSDWLITVRK